MSEELKLKPCPFCGTDEFEIVEYEGEDWIMCNKCTSSMMNISESSPDAWNTRPIEDALRADLARMTTRLKQIEKELEAGDRAYRGIIADKTQELLDFRKKYDVLKEDMTKTVNLMKCWMEMYESAKEAYEKYKAERDALKERETAILQYKLDIMIEKRDELKAALEKLRVKEHYECEDNWYSCPKHSEYIGEDDRTRCNCGMDETNAIIDAALEAQKGGEK